MNRDALKLFAMSTVLACAVAAAPARSADAESVAVVNGQAIEQSVLDAYARRRARQAPGKEQPGRDQLIGELVAQELLVQDAERQGFNEDPELRADVEILRRGLLAARAVAAYLDAHPVTEERLRAEYDEIAPRLAAPEYKARHILLEDEAAAVAVIGELEGGADFAQLARERSTGPSGENGGDLGWFSAEQMVPAFATALEGMDAGAYTAEPVQTRFGWHVILLEDRREGSAPPYEELEDRLRTLLEQRATQAYLNELRAEAELEYGD